MGLWAMGVSASNAGAELSAAAAQQAAAREVLIDGLAAEHGLTREQAEQRLQQARGVLKTYGHDRAPSEQTGVAAPVVVKGDEYQVVGRAELSGGDRVTEVTRAIGGGRFATRRIVERVDGGNFTRVVSEARGG